MSGGIGVGIGASALTFNNLEEIIAFGNGAGNAAGRPAIAVINDNLHNRVPEMLALLLKKLSRNDLFESMELSNQSKNRAKYLDPLIGTGRVAMEYPDETAIQRTKRSGPPGVSHRGPRESAVPPLKVSTS